MVASLGQKRGMDLLPSAHDYRRLLAGLAARGVVDGVLGTTSASEDGFDLETFQRVVGALRAWAEEASRGK